MPLKINGSTSGSVTLAAPATGSDVTLTLPTLGFGKVLQVVAATYSTQTQNNTNVLADTGLSATITPSSTSSKILVVVSQIGCSKNENNVDNAIVLKLLRGSTQLSGLTEFGGYTGTAVRLLGLSYSMTYLDSPNTTSATTYKTQFRNYANATGVLVQDGASVSSITLIEVGP